MKNLLSQRQWSWGVSGIALGAVFLLSVALVKPIGVSTQFVILDGILWDAVSDDLVTEDTGSPSGYSSSNAYLARSGGKHAREVANPLNYSMVFVLAMAVGGFAASRLQAKSDEKRLLVAPEVWRRRFGDSSCKRYAAAFAGGVLVLFGARLAGGCTSGHMMSGMMQTSVSGYLFALGAFVVAVPAGILIFRRGR